MDSNASASMIHDSDVCTNNFTTRNFFANQWSMMAGSFLTLREAELKVKLLKLNVTAHIFAPFYVSSKIAILM